MVIDLSLHKRSAAVGHLIYLSATVEVNYLLNHCVENPTIGIDSNWPLKMIFNDIEKYINGLTSMGSYK